MRGHMGCGPLEQGPFGCGPFGPYGRFGCQEWTFGPTSFGPAGPGFFDGRPGCCRGDSGPDSGRRRGPCRCQKDSRPEGRQEGQPDSGNEGPRERGNCNRCQEESGPEGPRSSGHQGPHRRCSGRRGRGCESSDEEARDRSRSGEQRDGSPGRRHGCRRHHIGPFGHGGRFGHGGPFGYGGHFGHGGPFGHRGPFDHRGPFGHRGVFGHGHLGPFGRHEFRGYRPFGGGPFGTLDLIASNERGNCQNDGCVRDQGRSKNKDQRKNCETEGGRTKENRPCGSRDKDQSGTVLYQRIVVESPRSYSV